MYYTLDVGADASERRNTEHVNYIIALLFYLYG